MMFSMQSLARKCDGKALARHQVMLLLQRLGEENWKGERALDIAVSQEKEDPSQDQG